MKDASTWDRELDAMKDQHLRFGVAFSMVDFIRSIQVDALEAAMQQAKTLPIRYDETDLRPMIAERIRYLVTQINRSGK